MPPTICAKCGERPRGSHVAYCRECWNAYQSTYRKHRYATEPEYREKILGRIRTRLYGISPEEYSEMLAQQRGLCAVCSRPPKQRQLSVDHNHKTGAIRGLLCGDCNGAIGMLREDPALFAKALAYLKLGEPST